ncbi:MAG: hypothetical protein CSA81_01960 [Acidobacteria bacterium]|nr:MAG: hypothetical protein CSA81_01960 [Acidobacteriota bacterium]
MTLTGTTIGHIDLMGHLGSGGMGDVYEAYDRKLDRRVAVKAIRRDLVRNQSATSGLYREAKILSKLEHRHVCRLYDLIESNEGTFLVMELVSGKNLKKYLESKPSYNEKLRIAREITSALVAAHELSIVHRDLKPSNIMITRKGHVKILDFGIAEHLLDVSLHFSRQRTSRGTQIDSFASEMETVKNQIQGTPMYMSPEQANTEPSTTASDMYSLGLIFQEMFTEKPFYSPGSAVESVLWNAIHGETLPVEGLGKDLTKLINRLKDIRPARRPSAIEVGEKLKWIQAIPSRRIKKGVLAAFLVLLILGTIFSTLGFYRAKRSAEATQKINSFLSEMLMSVDPHEEGIELKVIDLLDDAQEKIETKFAEYPLIQADLHRTFGKIYLSLGVFDKTYQHALSAEELYVEHYGTRNQESLNSMNLKALSLSKLGRFEESERLFEEIVDIQKQILGEEHPDTLASLGNLGIQKIELGKYQEAETILKQVVHLERRVLGVEHPSTLVSKGNLALVFMSLGQYETAEEVLLDLLQSTKRVLGKEHPDTLTAMSNLATTYSELGRYNEARRLFQKVVDIEERVLGRDHPDTLISMNNLANTLLKLELYDQAQNLRREIIEINTRELGPNHPNTLVSKCNLATALSNMGQYEKAESMQIDLLKELEEVFGENHPIVLVTINNLAKTKWELKRVHEAELLQRKAVGKALETFGNEHPTTIKMIERLIEMLQANGKDADEFKKMLQN